MWNAFTLVPTAIIYGFLFSLCMGVNFPDVQYVINWGPAHSFLDQHQEAGRDGEKSHVIVLFNGQQVAHCAQEVKYFIRAEGCFRVAAFKTLDDSIQPLEPRHDCCYFCSQLCKCGGRGCGAPTLPFEEAKEPAVEDTKAQCRQVSCQDRKALKEALIEVLDEMSSKGPALDDSSCHGFSRRWIEDVVRDCEKIFTLADLLTGYPVFSMTNAFKILSSDPVSWTFLILKNYWHLCSKIPLVQFYKENQIRITGLILKLYPSVWTVTQKVKNCDVLHHFVRPVLSRG